MNQCECFKVGARLLGLWNIIEAVADFRAMVDIRMEFFRPERMTAQGYAVGAIVEMVVGGYLLFGARHLSGLVHKGEIEAKSRNVAKDNPV